MLHVCEHGDLSGLQISFSALETVGDFSIWRRGLLNRRRQFGTLIVEETLDDKISNVRNVCLMRGLLMVEITSCWERAEISVGITKMLSEIDTGALSSGATVPEMDVRLQNRLFSKNDIAKSIICHSVIGAGVVAWSARSERSSMLLKTVSAGWEMSQHMS